jgi:hypothetical protein
MQLQLPHIAIGAQESDSDTWSQLYVQLDGTLDTSITRAIHSRLTITEGDGTNAGTAVFGDAIVDTDDDVQHIVGVQGYARHAGTGNVNQLIALNSKLVNDGNGTIDNMYGLFMYGPTSGDGVTNAYGIYINDFAGYGSSVSYAIWSGNGPVRFGGLLTVDNQLHVENHIEVNSGGGLAIGLGANTAPSNPLHVKSNGAAQVATLTSDQSATIVAVTDSGGAEVDIIASSTFGHAILGNGAYTLRFGANGTPSWGIVAAGHFEPLTDNTYDVGASGAKIRDLYIGRNIYAGSIPTTDPSSTGEIYADRGILMQSGFSAPLAGGAVTILYTFSTTTTNSDPGNGTLRLDNATQNSATTIRADLLDANGATWTSVIDSFDDSTSTIKGYIRLTKASDPTKWLLFTVSAVDSSSGYRNITVANIASSASSPFSNNDKIILDFSLVANKGVDGTNGTNGTNGTKFTPTATKTSTYTAAVGDLVISNGAQITCPASPSNGDAFAVFAVTASGAAINANTGQTLDGKAVDASGTPNSLVIPNINDFAVFYYNSNRTAWEIQYNAETIVDTYNPNSLGGDLFSNSSSTWTKRTGLKSVDVYCIGAGGGGGGGRIGAAGGIRAGGAGGGPGGWSYQSFTAAALGSTETVQAGAAGVGGNGSSTSNTDGGAGGAGGDSKFGTWLWGQGGGAGTGGTNAANTGGGGAGLGFLMGSAGGSDNGGGGAGTPPTAVNYFSPNGGGGGGRIVIANTADNGVTGGSTAGATKPSAMAGGTGGTGGASSTAGNDGTGATAGEPQGGAGGGGGGSGPNSTAAGGKNGGKGGLYGGGGGGGGGATNGSAGSGNGGRGGNGVVIVINYF